MNAHPVLPGVTLGTGSALPLYKPYLEAWREQAISQADDGEVAASVCHQATLIDLVLDGRPTHDWLSIMEDLLTDADGRPVAYSKGYGNRLHAFENQFLQSTVHSIHTRWWIEMIARPQAVDHDRFAERILAKKGSDSLILDADVSVTRLRHRMKVELSMSAVMGAEILSAADHLSEDLSSELAASLCDPIKIPPLYLACEQFRLAALRILGHEEQFPVGIDLLIKNCEQGLDHGWCDFAMATKVDAYMGTAKRIQRDKPIHSPLVGCHVAILSSKVDDQILQTEITDRLAAYSAILAQSPLDIPAFRMRDMPFRFGADITPIEAICATHLITNFQPRGDQ